jgi:hypothetical protein
MLTLPHPRMSFRRFVLTPAAEIAPRMLHPTIGWPIERLLLHLDLASDQAAIVSPSEALRRRIAQMIVERFAAKNVERPNFARAEQLWPDSVSTWIAIEPRAIDDKSTGSQPAALPYGAAVFPKLTILLDADPQRETHLKSQWSAIVRQPGRGPTLRLQTTETATIEAEVAAAVESVWPLV